ISQCSKMFNHKVTDPDGANLPLFKESFQCAVGIEGLVKLAGHGLMQQQQVDDINAELASAFVKSVQGLIEPVVGDPDFSLQKDLVTGQPRVADRLTDCTFVVIRRCGVDYPVAHLKRPGHGSGS